jgi:hypothetical protein
VNQRSRLQGVAGPLISQVARREPAQVAVNKLG